MDWWVVIPGLEDTGGILYIIEILYFVILFSTSVLCLSSHNNIVYPFPRTAQS